MDLSLSDAARLLGKTPRQVRYMVKTGRITAQKGDNGRWVIDSDALPLSDGQLRARARKVGALRDAVTDALGPHLETRRKRGYSVRETAAFTVGGPVYRRAVDALGVEHAGVAALRDALVAVSQGVHRYHGRDKHQAYSQAREHGARATALLLLDGDEGATVLAAEVEQEILPAITGLIRRYERDRGRA